jgi:uncharacterized membrane protein YhhN
MVYGLLAGVVMLTHLAFVLFVIGGGLLVLKWPRIAWLHVPAAIWGAMIEFMGWICPLTPLENRLLIESGESGYEGDFIAHYLIPVVYPTALTRNMQILLGLLVLTINGALYAWSYAYKRQHREARLLPK